MLRRHWAPRLGDKAIASTRPQDIASYIAAARGSGLAVKAVTNHLNFAHGVFGLAVRRGWAPSNPVAATDRPRAQPVDPDIRFLDREELEAVLRAAVRDDVLGPTDAVLFLTAATTGLRQGELAALRWRDVDWAAGVVRVRRSYSRGEWGAPKSRRSSRAVPLPDRTAAEAEQLGVSEQFVEKDYYVTEILRVVAARLGDAVMFKGGTSLSKGWGLISRFSEDIDLFVNPDRFSPPAGKHRVDRILTELAQAVGDHPTLTWLEDESVTMGGFGREEFLAPCCRDQALTR